MARHAAAILARIAFSNAASQAAVREAGGISLLVELCEDALDNWAMSEDDCQAAQHGAGALWILAVDDACKAEIKQHGQGTALAALAAMIGGKAGPKAAGNAAGTFPTQRKPARTLSASCLLTDSCTCTCLARVMRRCPS